MNEIIFAGFIPGGYEWILILLAVLLLFGGTKLPQLAKALGQSKRAFREGQEEAEAEDLRAKNLAAGDKPIGALAETDDEALFAEARRRERLRAGESR